MCSIELFLNFKTKTETFFVTRMLVSDFAAAAVLISFGVVIGKTSPLQLIVMTLIEIVFYVVNEVIGRNLLGVRTLLRSEMH
jgi:hypothetical protein